MNERSSSGVRSVAIVGRGRAAWLAAIAVHRAFAGNGVEVTVVELPGQEPSQAFHATLPDLAKFHKSLGIAERTLLRGAEAAYAVGQEFVGWSGDNGAYLHGYGETGEAIHGLPFVQFWARARQRGLATTFDDFSLSAAAALHGRLAPPGARRTVSYGLHLDAAGYLAVLRRQAASLGIARIADRGPVPTIRDGAIAELRLSSGHAITADLYIDATGSEAGLIDRVDPGGRFEAPTLPCDRLITATASPLAPPPLHSRIIAHPTGWVGVFPLADRTGISMAYSGAILGDDRAAGTLAALTGLRVAPDMIVDGMPDRIRSRPWVGNCVAIGAAAARGDPLDAVELHRDQIAIAHLVSLLPVDRAAMVEAGIYNDEVVAYYLRLRDFQAAHYRLNARHGEPFWDAVRAVTVSDQLDTKIALFEARGMIAQHDHESFNADSWQSLLVGHGVIPRSVDPRAAIVPDGEIAQRLQGILRTVAGDIGGFVPHQVVREQVLSG